MRFDTIRYMEWAKIHQSIRPVRYDLSSSAVAPPTPAEIGVTAEDASWEGENHYGHPELRGLIAARYGVLPENVLPCGGSSLANFLFAAVLLQTGDAAALESIVYEPLRKILEALEVRILEVPRRKEDRFQPDVAAAERAFAGGAKLLILSDLHNPTGIHIDRARLQAIGASAEKHGAHVLVDEVYLDALGARRPPIAATLGPQFLSTCSLTKVYGLGNLRAGWGVADPALVQRALRVYDYLSVLNSMPADRVAIRCHRKIDWLLERSLRTREANIPILRTWLDGRTDLEATTPDAGFITWIRLKSKARSLPLVDLLRSKYDAQVSPGHFFGCDDHIRIGCGMPQETLKEGLRRLGQALDELGR
ncbi:MAG: pyridoxal phosphate-dependent aminotransferase [Candidatus Brocadiae bacterium]|nr:pyridoxal phosphate-dependent aminotransferase [Candidatus Brocadiia bacterium]